MAKTLAEKIAVMQHYSSGGKIQYRYAKVSSGRWDESEVPTWNWNAFDYRQKPQPREVWVNEYPLGKLGCTYPSKNEAAQGASGCVIRQVKLLEVLDDE